MGKKKADYEPRNDGRVFREAEIVAETRDAGDGKTETIVRATVSSETPYPRTMWDEDSKAWVRGHEVLGHASGEIDESRMRDGLVIQDTHWGDQIGIIRKPELKDGKLGGVIEFGCGERAQEIARDAAAGIRRNMSVGYIVREYKKVGKADDGLPIFRVTKWTPYEASFVNVPADTNIGVGRVATPDENRETRAADIAAVNQEEKQMDAKTIAALMAQAERAHMKTADVTAMIEAGKSEAEIRSEIAERACAYADELAKKTAQPAPQKKTAIFDGGDVKTIMKKYDLMKVVRSLACERGVDDGFEREISDEIAKKAGRRTTKGGFFIPEQILAGRAMSVGLDGGANGGKLVATDTLFSEMVPALVAETVLGRAGVRTLTGLVGNVEIPTAGAATAYWVATEGGDASETTPAIGQIEARMHTVGAYTDITSNLMAQSGIGVQSFVADALRNALARAIETAAFSGDGTSGKPTGIDNANPAIVTVTGATNPGLEKILSFVSKINDENALGASMKFIGSPSVWAKLASTVAYEAVGEAASGLVSGKFLLDTETDKVQGYDFIKSNLSTAKTLYFGDWSKLLLAFWSGIELTVDPYSLSKSGGVRLVALQGMDVVITQPKAFAKGVVLS